MKDSEIEWLGHIPESWDVRPAFTLFSQNRKKNTDKNNNVLSLSYGKIKVRDLSRNFGLLPENFDSYQVVEDGYIIIRSTDLQNDKTSLRVGLVKEKGIITSAYLGLIPKNHINPNYGR